MRCLKGQSTSDTSHNRKKQKLEKNGLGYSIRETIIVSLKLYTEIIQAETALYPQSVFICKMQQANKA